MREIKYRAWHKHLHKWHYFTLDELFNGEGCEFGYQPFYEHKTEYTGLHDKNGREIYEGDLIKPASADRNQIIREVFWDDNYHGFRLSSSDSNKEIDKTIPLDFARIGEVVGNIYESHEFVEVKK